MLEGELDVVEALVELGRLLIEEAVHLIHQKFSLRVHGVETTLATGIVVVAAVGFASQISPQINSRAWEL